MRKFGVRSLTVMIYDVFVAVTAFYLSVSLIYGVAVPTPFQNSIQALQLFLIIATLQFSIFYFNGLYKSMVRFSSIPDLLRICRSIAIAAPSSYAAIYFYNRLETIHRTSFIIDAFLLLIGLAGGRLAYRIMKDSAVGKLKRLSQESHKRTLIIGAGFVGERLLREISMNARISLDVIGFVDDDRTKIGRSIRGITVLGPISRLDSLIAAHDIQHLIIAIPSASQSQVRQISQLCRDIDKQIELKILPPMSDVIDGKTSIKALRNIEPEDLLGRKAHDLDMKKMSTMLKGKVVLITGAGGSIGSELCKQVAKFQPKLLILFEITELFLYHLEQNLQAEFPEVPIRSIIGDVRNFKKLSHVFETFSPEVVFHAAAYKHVPLMELNPIEAVRTNVLGTYNVAMAAVKNQVDRFVLISSDKAINPTNVMGATKRIAELICLSSLSSPAAAAAAGIGSSVTGLPVDYGTKFTIVRFGNVLGSSGSVIPLFKKQIERGGPLTITHPDMKRYFMSIPEATQLVIQAGSIGKGSEVMVLDMGEPVKIKDLAYEMIALAGHKPEIDIKIEYTGLRPGEKLFEELFHPGEKVLPTLHPMIKIANPPLPNKSFKGNLDFLITLPDDTSNDVIKEAIKSLLPEYNHSELTTQAGEKIH